MRSAFSNCGQVCLGTERVYVERPIFDEFVARLKAGAEALKLRPARGSGDFARPAGQPGAPQQGAVLLQEGRRRRRDRRHRRRRARHAGRAGRRRLGPADHLDRTRPTTRTVVNEEIFGPCCHIRPFDTEEEAIRLANRTPYGLAAAVWSGEPLAAPTASPPDGRRHLLGQFLVPARSAHRFRRGQGSRASAARAVCIRSSSTPN